MHPNLALGVVFAIQQYLCPLGGPCKWFTSQPAAHKINLPWATVAVPSVPGATVPVAPLVMPSVISKPTAATKFALLRTETDITTAPTATVKVGVTPQDLDTDDTTTTPMEPTTPTKSATSIAIPSSEASEEVEPVQAASAPSSFGEYFAVLLCLVPLLLLGCIPSRRRRIDAEAWYHDLVERIQNAADRAAWDNLTSQYRELDSFLQQTRGIAGSSIKEFVGFVRNALTSLDNAESKLQACGKEEQRLKGLLANSDRIISQLGKGASSDRQKAYRYSQENEELRSSKETAEQKVNELKAEVQRQKEELRRRRVGAHDITGKKSELTPRTLPESQPQPARTGVKALFQREEMFQKTQEKLTIATERITALEKKASDDKENLAAAIKDVEDLKSEKLALGQEKDKQLQDLDAKLQQAKQEFRELDAETAAAITQLKKKVKDNEASAQEDINALRKDHEAEKTQLEDERRAAEARRNSAVEQIQRLESDKKALADQKENETEALRAEVHSARTRAIKVQQEMAGKETELAATKISLDKARAAVERRETTDKGTTTDDTTTTTITTINTADAEKMALQQQLDQADQANQERSALVQQLNQSSQDHSSALHQLEQLKAGSDLLAGQVSQLQQSQSEMGHGVEQLQQELAQAQADKLALYEQGKREFDQNNAVKDGEIQDLQGQIENLRKNLELSEQGREMVEKENKELTKQNEELQLDTEYWKAMDLAFEGIDFPNAVTARLSAPGQSLEQASGEAAQQEAPASSASAIGGNGEFNFNAPPMPTSSSGAQPTIAPASDPLARPATPVFSSIPGLFTGQTPTPDQPNQPAGQGIARAYNIPRSRRPRTAPRTTAEGSSSALPPPALQPLTPGQDSQAKREADPEDHYTHSVVGVRQPLSQQPVSAVQGMTVEGVQQISEDIADQPSSSAGPENGDPRLNPTSEEFSDKVFMQFNPLMNAELNPAMAAALDWPASSTDEGPLHFPPEALMPELMEQNEPIDEAMLAQNQPPVSTPARESSPSSEEE
ncbi:MAG: hypothetical protein LQ351_001555 [Letrouitia transgressa]|nr:MAG: hypothetical protein LQ351_001555 [Letrouitia transgressa]